MIVAIVNRHLEDKIGGSELQCDIIARELAGLGHTPVYLAARGQRGSYEAPYRVEPLPEFSAENFSMALERISPDLVFWRYNKHELTGCVRAARLRSIPFVFSVSNRNDLVRFRFDLLRPRKSAGITFDNWHLFLQTCRQYGGLALVDGVANQCRELMGRVGAVPEIYFPNSMHDRSEAFEWPRPYIAWVANIKERKNPRDYIRLAERVGDRGVDFLMAGEIQQKFYDFLRDSANLPPNLHYLGAKSIEEANGIIRGSLFLVHTCDPEGFPNTFIQAWHYGRPVISRHYDPDGLIVSEGLGAFPRSDEAFVAEVEKMIGDASLRKQTGERAAAFARERFDPGRNVRSLAEFLESVRR